MANDNLMYFADAYMSISDCLPKVFLRDSMSKTKVMLDFVQVSQTYTISSDSGDVVEYHEVLALECVLVSDDDDEHQCGLLGIMNNQIYFIDLSFS